MTSVIFQFWGALIIASFNVSQKDTPLPFALGAINSKVIFEVYKLKI